MHSELMELLKKGQFKLAKWILDYPRVFEIIPANCRLQWYRRLNARSLATKHTLRVQWDTGT